MNIQTTTFTNTAYGTTIQPAALLIRSSPEPRYIYHVHRIDTVRYDEASSFVVVARDSKVARELCAANCGGEGPDVWKSGRRSGRPHAKVRKIGNARVPNGFPAAERVVVREYRAG